MTVCLALVAGRKKVIVLAADRLVTDENDNVYEGEEDKKREIGFGWHFLFAGSFSLANRLMDDLRDDLETDLARKRLRLPVRAAYMKRLVVGAVLRMRQREARRVGERPAKHELGLDGLVAGFDERNRAYVFCVDEDGGLEDAVADGRALLGSGGPGAKQRFLVLRPHKIDPLDRALYHAYDAKRHAESSAFVGKNTDMWVMTHYQDARSDRLPDSKQQPERVTGQTVRLLRSVFRVSSASPFEGRPGMPADWKKTLRGHARLLLDNQRRAASSRASSPTVLAPPSVRPRSGGSR